MQQESGIPAKRVFPGAEGLWMEFYTSVEAQNCYDQIQAKGGRAEIEGCTVILKHPKKSTPSDGVNH